MQKCLLSDMEYIRVFLPLLQNIHILKGNAQCFESFVVRLMLSQI